MAKFSFDRMPSYQVLTQQEILQIHEKALELLETTGVKFEHPDILAELGRKGCEADLKNMVLRIPRKLAEDAVLSAPEHFEMYNRDGEVTLRLGEGSSYYAPGPGAPNIAGSAFNRRFGTSEDLKEALRITESSPGYQISSGSVVPGDTPSIITDVYILYQMILHSRKTLLAEAWEESSVKRVGKLLEAVCGTKELVREKPFVLLAACPSPPMRWEKRVIDNALDSMEYGIPLFLSPSPVMGVSCPVTIAGSVLTHTVESLSFLTFIQLMHPGHKVLYGGIPGVMDMRSTYCSSSSIEPCLSTAAYACMGRYYGLPTLAFLAQTDAKESDYQAGFETAMDLMTATLAGIDIVFGGGTLDSYLCTSNEKLAMDGQFFRYCRRLQDRIMVNEETLAQDEIREINWGEDGVFLELEHTADWYQKEQCMLDGIADKVNYEQSHSKYASITQRACTSIQSALSHPLEAERAECVQKAFCEIAESLDVDPSGLL
ncbi:hypothetical protein C3B58_01010 [Lactonifactor longoviformis]|uniref:Trimethylamine---corrinoid protein Co-methyltransferase n=1 Tax=Lactonifactor longoviformis DSM 17459 TaxID=1122155 RepID=A0A1M4WGY2_9CLOT|nr:trimethylamine methyltransferase family protein [Lactonifactor longoviformis]POP34863.1 hypothetical protein C3B58_01010 [Lactonifactor longoviformis]SHE80222.1 trimethylamine---corrinoid protein Co-methyltransferase [Lactonifactor longoviformis DSM 17459]